ncbi:MAG: hypothetical protein H7645_08380 [Candidatus Heimdallarchaeota archaeon]|nr:hypothetical protein [Candidatus Heimdallarchaeota archaeon]MCK4770341.1 hypothetical protein [Candidatus Heimdallarchaeota archaeon]
MKMNKSLFFLFLIFAVLLPFITNNQAHSPSGIILQYDFSSQTLDVTVTHSVPSVDTHYIEEIKIWVNDVEDQTEAYTSQTSTSEHQDSFTVTASHNDVIKVRATCSISGSFTDEIVVADPAIPEFGIIFPIIAFVVIGSILGYAYHKKHTKSE